MISARIEEEAKAKLERIAAEQHRPISNLVRLILLGWLEEYERTGEIRLPKNSG